MFLPLTAQETAARGWDYVDIVLVTGDAYIDHPSFAMAVIGRMLEDAGFRVAILSRPKWTDCSDFRRFGKPRLFFAVGSGNVDSMIDNYTANKKPRSEDDYAPGRKGGGRPDRAATVYCQRAREAFPGVQVLLGGVEASMRRLAHYDYWSDTVRRSILLDSKADLLVFGMGDYTVTDIARRADRGENLRDMRGIRGTAYALGAGEAHSGQDAVSIPSFEEVKADKKLFSTATKAILENLNPYCARTLLQPHGDRLVVCNPPALPLAPDQLDKIYALPYRRQQHPSYTEPVPALEMIKDSITAHRGCFGGCSFCSLALHQGKLIQSRSDESILAEARGLAASPKFAGTISDIGGPSANMHGMTCGDPEAMKTCRRHSCLFPSICRNLKADFTKQLRLLRAAEKIPGVKRVLVNSGIRMDLALLCPEYIEQLAARHTGGQLSVAPEHSVPHVLKFMGKPPSDVFVKFKEEFSKASRKAGKEQYLIPYLISGFPGCKLEDMADLAVFLKRLGYRPLQVNDFIPAPMELATSIYHTGLDPFTGQPVYVPRGEAERRLQRALLQYFKPENRGLVLKALRQCGRASAMKELFSAPAFRGGPHTGARHNDASRKRRPF